MTENGLKGRGVRKVAGIVVTGVCCEKQEFKQVGREFHKNYTRSYRTNDQRR